MLCRKTRVTDLTLHHMYAEDQWLTNPVMDNSFISKIRESWQAPEVAALVTELPKQALLNSHTGQLR